MKLDFAFPLAIAAVVATAVSAQPVRSVATVVAPEYEWGYRCGVKQGLGAYSLGLTVLGISRETGDYRGSPDYLLWVDEHAGTAAIHELGHDDANVANPGGQACFDDDDRVWYVLGARARDLPIDVLRFDEPESVNSWEIEFDDLISYEASTTPCLHVVGDTGFLAYRYAGSAVTAEVEVRVQQLDLPSATPLGETSVAMGSLIDGKRIGIEQLWTRYDSRVDALALTWQWFDVAEHRFGSNPFVFSRDDGITWYDAAGSQLTLPLAYEDRTDTLVPYDHLARGESAYWLPRDIGWTPDGTPFLLIPDGNLNMVFWRWQDSSWEGQTLAEQFVVATNPFAGGATRDYMIVVYATSVAPGKLYAVTSRNNGQTWSAPRLVDSVEDDYIGTVTWIQPQRHIHNTARVVVLHHETLRNISKNYQNAVRLVTIQIGPRSDFNGDGIVDPRDVEAFVAAWIPGDWRSDFDENGTVDIYDLIAFMEAYTT